MQGGNFESEIDLQELSGIGKGHIFHSANAYIIIINDEMRRNLVYEIGSLKIEISQIIEGPLL
jgi:hypothetical protein